MLRIFLIIAIVGAIAATAVSAWKVREVLTTAMTDRDTFHNERDQARKERDDTKKTLAQTKKNLDETTAKLTQTTTELTAANSKVTDLEAQNKDLTTTLNKTKNERDTAQQDLEKWRQLNLSPEQVRGTISNLTEMTKERNTLIAENKVVTASRDDWKARYQALVNVDEQVQEPPGLKGRIVDVDPKFNFVVLNIGSDNGVLPRGEMLVNNNGKFVGKVRIVSVQKNSSIANILPDWKRGDISETCTVID